MSLTLLVVGEQSRSGIPPPSDLKAAFPGLRLVLRVDEGRFSVEPFRGTASLAALVGIRKSRERSLAEIRALVCSLFASFRVVAIELRDERLESLNECSVSLVEALRALAVLRPGRYLVQPLPIKYVAHRVEARLFEPLRVEGGGEAVGYFCDYDVVAPDEHSARELLVVDLAQEGAAFVGWGSLELAEVLSEDVNSAAVRTSGRIFFGRDAPSRK